MACLELRLLIFFGPGTFEGRCEAGTAPQRSLAADLGVQVFQYLLGEQSS